MSKKFPLRIYVQAISLIVLVISYAGYEVYHHLNAPSDQDIENIASESVNVASNVFESYVDDFRAKSSKIRTSIDSLIEADSLGLSSIHDTLQSEEELWGAVLYKNSIPLVWSGFKLPNYEPDTKGNFLKLKISQLGNVWSLISINELKSESNSANTLILAKKLRQANILELGNEIETTVSNAIGLNTKFPVEFSLGEAIPEEIIYKSELNLSFEDDDTITIYAPYTGLEIFNNSRDTNHAKIRLIFVISFFIFGGFFLLSIGKQYDSQLSFLISSITIFMVWLLSWILLPMINLDLILGMGTIPIELFYLGLNTLLALAFSIIITDFYYANEFIQHKLSDKFGALVLAFIGALIAVVSSGILASLFNISANTALNLTDLSLYPDIDVILYYIFSGLIWITTSWSAVFLLIFVLRASEARTILSSLSLASGYATGIFFVIYFFLEDSQVWIIFMSIFCFVLLSLLSFLSNIRIIRLREYSRLRLFIFATILAVLFSYIPFFNGKQEWQSHQMLNQAKEFANTGQVRIESTTVETLLSLERELSSLNLSSLDGNRVYISSEFQDGIETILDQNSEWQDFSFSIQLIDTDGNSISEYTSNLNAPGWTKTYDMFSLEVPYEQERIRRERLRPIIRENPLEQPPARYTSFRQGWIPFFTSPESETKLGWILCSVYLELPQYRKPLRAVVASKKAEDKHTSFLFSEYKNGRLIKSSISGPPEEIPNYNIIPDQIHQQILQDTTITSKENISGRKVSELFWLSPSGNIIKASTLSVSWFNHIYSLLRFFFYLLAFILLFSLLLQWRRDFQILGANTRFKDRLIDRFILASVICLFALVTGSSIAITNQSEKIITEELENKLSGIHSTFEERSSKSITEELLFSSTLINSDAVLFSENTVIGSTAPQIFTQHLLPAQVPWNIYDDFKNDKIDYAFEITNLGDLEFLIGFTPIRENGELKYISAIPTFLKTPSFNEQLLSTISYLVGIFSLVFGMFILLASYIANRMTSPLEELSEGIKTISDGSLETTLPVKSNDEIGSLTNTFNIMVYRLQELRKNLVEVEREAAWKEMAQQVAHEIKNPLTPMKLNLQHLERQLKSKDVSPEDLKKKVSKINSNMIDQIDALSRIASDFSKFARPMEQELEKIDLNKTLENVADLYSNERSVTLRNQIQKTPLWINGVKDELQRVFINLVKNGIEAIPKRRKGVITIKSWHADYKANIEISDNGEGIPKENERSIFIPNFSTKTSGTGLGLAITKKIIEEHGGSIEFHSVEGKGTTFIIRFDLFTEKT